MTVITMMLVMTVAMENTMMIPTVVKNIMMVARPKLVGPTHTPWHMDTRHYHIRRTHFIASWWGCRVGLGGWCVSAWPQSVEVLLLCVGGRCRFFATQLVFFLFSPFPEGRIYVFTIVGPQFVSLRAHYGQPNSELCFLHGRGGHSQTNHEKLVGK